MTPDTTPQTHPLDEWVTRAKAVYDALPILPGETSDRLFWHRMEAKGLTFQEIAEQTGIPAADVRGIFNTINDIIPIGCGACVHVDGRVARMEVAS